MSAAIDLAVVNVELIRAVQDGSVDDSCFKDGRRVADVAFTLFSNVGSAISEMPTVELPNEVAEALKDPAIVAMLFERLYHEKDRIASDLWAVSQLEQPDFTWDCDDDREYSLWLLLEEHVSYSHALKAAKLFSQIENDHRFVAARQWFDRRNELLRANADVFRSVVAGYAGWAVPATFDSRQEWWYLLTRERAS